jgi:hypothetical protein
VHFTEAYEGISDIAPDRLKALYREINEYFYNKGGVPQEIEVLSAEKNNC